MMFELRKLLARFIMEKALVQIVKMFDPASSNLTLRSLDPWDSLSTHEVIQRVFIFWEPPLLTFLKVNYDGSMMGSYGGAGFMIRGPDSRLVAMEGSHLFETSNLGTQLWAAWVDIAYARL